MTISRCLPPVLLAVTFVGCYSEIRMRPVVGVGSAYEVEVRDDNFHAVSVVDSTMVWAGLTRESVEGNFRIYLGVKNFHRNSVLFDPERIELYTDEEVKLTIWSADKWMHKKQLQDLGRAITAASNDQPMVFTSGTYADILLRANTLHQGGFTNGFLFTKYRRSKRYGLLVPVGSPLSLSSFPHRYSHGSLEHLDRWSK